MDLRYMFLTSHYRSFIDFTWENLEKARKGRLKLIRKITKILKKLIEYHRQSDNKSQSIEDLLSVIKDKLSVIEYDKDLKDKLEDAVLDDLNTPKAIAQIHYILGELEKQISNKDAR
jgi:cysteinyl-tRNA synthetase